MNPDHAKRLRQRIETMNKLRGRPLTNVEKLANIRRAFDEEDAMNKDHAKRVQEWRNTPVFVIAVSLSGSKYPSPRRMAQAKKIAADLVAHGYTIEPIEEDHED